MAFYDVKVTLFAYGLEVDDDVDGEELRQREHDRWRDQALADPRTRYVACAVTVAKRARTRPRRGSRPSDDG
jgi:hypothetical protein